MSRVYFTDFKANSKNNVFSKIKKLFNKGEFDFKINKDDFIAIKTHFGEYGNIAYIPAQIIKIFVDIIIQSEGVPFVTDSNTLYRGSRSNALDHLNNARKNGFVNEVIGAPVLIADGLRGNDYKKIEVKSKHYNEIKIASAIFDSDAVIAVSHIKGHELYGFGGAIKNIAMGCSPPSGKQTIHSDLIPQVIESKCTSCGACIKRCPAYAIYYNNSKKAVIDEDKCVSCGECTVICPAYAIPVIFKTDHKALHERTAEYAQGIIDAKPGKWMFFNFIMNVVPECDCFFWNDIPIVNDIGILASEDPVSIDRASADFVNNASPIKNSKIWEKEGLGDNLNKLYDIDWRYLLDYSESIGLGDNKYELITL